MTFAFMSFLLCRLIVYCAHEFTKCRSNLFHINPNDRW